MERFIYDYCNKIVDCEQIVFFIWYVSSDIVEWSFNSNDWNNFEMNKQMCCEYCVNKYYNFFFWIIVVWWLQIDSLKLDFVYFYY